MASRQLPLDLPVEARYGAEDFLISDCNEAAYRFLETWPAWQTPFALLIGPAGSGKSHLAAIFAARSGGASVAAETLTAGRVPELVRHPAVVVEDADRHLTVEADLFHLLNMAREAGSAVLLTARAPLTAWNLRTADLHSRLRLATRLDIAPPDDSLLRALLVKMFVDRQLAIDTHVIDYLAVRIERSFAACRAVVEALDREALAQGRRVTRAMAAQVVSQHQDDDAGR